MNSNYRMNKFSFSGILVSAFIFLYKQTLNNIIMLLGKIQHQRQGSLCLFLYCFLEYNFEACYQSLALYCVCVKQSYFLRITLCSFLLKRDKIRSMHITHRLMWQHKIGQEFYSSFQFSLTFHSLYRAQHLDWFPLENVPATFSLHFTSRRLPPEPFSLLRTFISYTASRRQQTIQNPKTPLLPQLLEIWMEGKPKQKGKMRTNINRCNKIDWKSDGYIMERETG